MAEAEAARRASVTVVSSRVIRALAGLAHTPVPCAASRRHSGPIAAAALIENQRRAIPNEASARSSPPRSLDGSAHRPASLHATGRVTTTNVNKRGTEANGVIRIV